MAWYFLAALRIIPYQLKNDFLGIETLAVKQLSQAVIQISGEKER
jgi:hypothetical protein